MTSDLVKEVMDDIQLDFFLVIYIYARYLIHFSNFSLVGLQKLYVYF